MNLTICDDLPEEREKLLALLEQAPIATICTQFGSSEELLEAFRPGKFDLLLMDIYMDGMTGVEAVQKIREMDECIPIAFTTTSTEHTFESYRLSVLKYLEKPVRPAAPAGGAALFLPPQELLRQPGLCPGDQCGISVL